MECYQLALKYNQWSVPAMQGIACILRTKDAFPQAVEYLRTILKVDPANGDVWGSLGHCYLMMDDLQQAYSAYQQALYHLSDPKVRCLLVSQVRLQSTNSCTGAKALVRHRHSVRPLRLFGARRRGFLPGHAHGAQFRKGKRDLLSSWYNIQATAEVQPEFRRKYKLIDSKTKSDKALVLQVHRHQPTSSSDRRRHLVPDWSRL